MRFVVPLIEHYGLLVIFLSAFLDAAGLPAPSYPALMVAGALSLRSGLPWPAILAAALAGSGCADMAWYAAGHRFGRRVMALLCRISLSPDNCVRQTETMFLRTGAWSLLFSKFVPGLGTLAVALSGVTRVGLARFAVLDAAGDAIYFIVPIALGMLFHNAVDSVLATLTQLGELGLILVVSAFALYLTVRWFQRQAFIRQLRMDRISVEELATLIDGGLSPVIFDVRPSEVRLSEGIIPGALPAHLDDIETALRSTPRDREIVVYCSCPNEASAALAARHLKRAGYKKIRPLLGGVEAWAKSGRPLEMSN